MLEFKNKLKSIVEKNMQMTFFLIAGCFFILTQACQEKAQPDKMPIQTEDVSPAIDTFIPRGYTLIPIEIENKEQLSSLIDEKGIVHLYAYGDNSQKRSSLVAKNVRLVRAPKNPEVFAVLIKETQINQVMSHKGPFRAVIQNVDQTDQEIISTSSSRVQIEYQN